jgi:hypothetical protein
MAEVGHGGSLLVEAQHSRVSIRPQRSGMNGLSEVSRPHSASPSQSSYSQYGARGGKFSSAKPKSDVEWAIYRAKQQPGPGQYQHKEIIPKGGRFNMSNPKSDIDWIIKQASEQPGPGDYKPPEVGKPTGGRFSTGRPKSNLDWTIFYANQRPGPGQYHPDGHYKVNGGRFSNSKPKSDVDWSIYRAKQQPGPGQYQVSKGITLPGGKFNMSNPKSDVDWAILKASQSPSPQDYLIDSGYRVGGGKFSTARPKSALDWTIHRSKLCPGPGEYNSELNAIGRRSGVPLDRYNPSQPSLPVKDRPKSADGIPPEARGKVRPTSGLNQKSNDSLYGIGNDRPKRPSTSLGIPPEARGLGKTNPQRPGTAESRGKLPPRATSAPPGPRAVPTSPTSRPETPAGGKTPQSSSSRQEVHVAMPNARPGSSGSSRVYVGPEPKTYTGPESVRPESVRQPVVINSKPKPKGRTISTQASEEDFRIMQRDLEKAEKDKKSSQSKPSRTGRPVSAKDDLVSNRGLNAKPKKLPASYQRPGTVITTTSMRKQKNAEDKKKIAYPIPQTLSAASSGCRSRLSDNARKLFDLAMQSHEFKNMMELYTGVKDPTDVIEKYAAMWSYQPLFDGRRTR